MVKSHIRVITSFEAAAGLALSAAYAVAVRAQSPAFPTNAALDSLVTKQMADAGIMGLGAAVIVDRQVVWMKGYGFADRARARPFTPNTIMNVGSIAKPFVGVAMMRAVHEGMLSLEEDINTTSTRTCHSGWSTHTIRTRESHSGTSRPIAPASRTGGRSTFRDADTAALASGRRPQRFANIAIVARRKLRQVEIAGGVKTCACRRATG